MVLRSRRLPSVGLMIGLLATVATVATAQEATRSAIDRASALRDRGDLAGAFAALRQAAPDDAKGLGLLGDLALDLGRIADAESAYAALAARDQGPETAARLAALAAAKGDAADAEAKLREALADVQKAGRPAIEVAPYQARLADLLYQLGRIDEADKEYKAANRAIDAEHAKLHELNIPHDEATYFHVGIASGLARILAAKGDAKKAERAWRVVASRATDPAPLIAAGEFFAMIDKAKDADALFARAEAAAGDRPEARRVLARFYSDHGRKLDRALVIAEAEAASRVDAATLDLLAWALHKNGRDDRAAEAIDRALKSGLADAGRLYRAAAIHHESGRDDDARRELEAALALNPNFSLLDAPKAKRLLALLSGSRP